MKLILCIIIFLLSGCSLGEVYSRNTSDALDIHYRFENIDASIGSELNRPSRIDANPSETYFWVRLNYGIKNGIFLESYQSSNVIIKSHPNLSLSYIWDGIWLRSGIFYRIQNWIFEGGPIYYTFSSSRRSSNWGFLINIGWEF